MKKIKTGYDAATIDHPPRGGDGPKPWQENDHLRFHWALIRGDVAKDLEVAQNS